MKKIRKIVLSMYSVYSLKQLSRLQRGREREKKGGFFTAKSQRPSNCSDSRQPTGALKIISLRLRSVSTVHPSMRSLLFPLRSLLLPPLLRSSANVNSSRPRAAAAATTVSVSALSGASIYFLHTANRLRADDGSAAMAEADLKEFCKVSQARTKL